MSYRDADGNIQTIGNAGGVHAEMRVQDIMGPDTPVSRPFGWRTLETDLGPQWVEGTVCTGCQQLPQSLFPEDVRGAPGRPWGHDG